MEITVAEAAARLGVTERRVQQLASSGRLQVVRRVGRSLLVDDAAVLTLSRIGRTPGRHWGPRTAWAAIELVARGTTDRLEGSALSRLKRRLDDVDVETFARLASGRAGTRRVTQTRRTAQALADRLVVSGTTTFGSPEVAAAFGLAGGIGTRLEGYVVRDQADSLTEQFGLIDDAEGEVFLHISDVEPFASLVTTALDLLERGTSREQSAATELLRRRLTR